MGPYKFCFNGWGACSPQHPIVLLSLHHRAEAVENLGEQKSVIKMNYPYIRDARSGIVVLFLSLILFWSNSRTSANALDLIRTPQISVLRMGDILESPCVAPSLIPRGNSVGLENCTTRLGLWREFNLAFSLGPVRIILAQRAVNPVVFKKKNPSPNLTKTTPIWPDASTVYIVPERENLWFIYLSLLRV